MKKRVLCLACILLILLTGGCRGTLPGTLIPKEYADAELHFDPEGIQDHTDFCIYRYESIDAFDKIPQYQKVKEKDIEEIKGYLQNFKSFMEAQNRLSEYTFDETGLTAGDLFFVETKEGEKIGEDSQYEKYDHYTLYLLDVDTKTLYYFHTNI